MDEPRVAVHLEEGVAQLRLSDPGRRNVIDAVSSGQLATAVARALDDGARAIVLSAQPPVFCAGGALDGLLDAHADLAPWYEGFLALAAAPVPTIAAVDGACVGAGLNLPLCCDVVLVSPAARFDPRFLDVGLHPGGGHLLRLSRRVGAQGAAALVLMGDTLDGHEAVEHGLAWRCVESDQLMPLALRFARRVAGRSDALVRRTKQSLHDAVAGQSEADAVAAEAQSQRWSRTLPGFAERIEAIRDGLRP